MRRECKCADRMYGNDIAKTGLVPQASEASAWDGSRA